MLQGILFIYQVANRLGIFRQRISHSAWETSKVDVKRRREGGQDDEDDHNCIYLAVKDEVLRMKRLLRGRCCEAWSKISKTTCRHCTYLILFSFHHFHFSVMNILASFLRSVSCLCYYRDHSHSSTYCVQYAHNLTAIYPRSAALVSGEEMGLYISSPFPPRCGSPADVQAAAGPCKLEKTEAVSGAMAINNQLAVALLTFERMHLATQ